MRRRFYLLLACLIAGGVPLRAAGQTPAPLPEELSAGDVDAALRILREKYPDQAALNKVPPGALGILQLRGVELLKKTPPESVPLFSGVIGGNLGYVQPGSLTAENLREFDKLYFLANKIAALVIDLRASASGNDIGAAAEFAQRFVKKGQTLWSIHRPETKGDQSVTSERDPKYAGPLLILIDEETRGAAEALAAALKARGDSLLIGAATAGIGAITTDFALPDGKTLRAPTAEIVGAHGSLFQKGIAPDVPVTLSGAQKARAFAEAKRHGLKAVIEEEERPHFNEAVLMAGSAPDLEARTAKRENSVYDPVLQRAVDIAISLIIFAKR